MKLTLTAALLLSAACGLLPNPAPDPKPDPKPVVVDDPILDEPAIPRPIAPHPTLAPKIEPAVFDTTPAIEKGNGGAAQEVSQPVLPPPAPRPATFDEVVETLREIAARNPNSKIDQNALAAALALKDRYPEALKLVPGGETAFSHADLFTRLLRIYLLEQLGEHSKAQSGLREIYDDIERREGIKITRGLLTTKVNGFADYQAAPSTVVEVGKKMEIYVEFCNFALKQEKDDFIMHLRYTWELIDDAGKVRVVKAWSDAPLELREDRIIKHGKVRDFFQVFRLPMPVLPAGRYTVRVGVDDLMSDKKRDVVDIPIQLNDYYPPNK